MSNLPAPLPAQNPCGSCPYRVDAPQGLWKPEAYDTLSDYDTETWEQPTKVFLCHSHNERICSGWAGTHSMEHNLGARLALSTGALSPQEYEALLAYRTDVETFDTGQQAAEHGKDTEPSPETIALSRKLDARFQQMPDKARD